MSEKLGLPNSTASVLVEKLVKEGLVSRVRDSEDRRRVIICLTDKAEKFVEEMRESHIVAFGKLMKNATEKEIEDILNGFRTLSNIIERDNEAPQT
ncbi:MarR family transcriptional regulator [Clostridium sp. OS1-26]|uniref:MarR family winged helix-turn-helix transcriptional regulator n=1 Tax=Clostridium sp. OS1-26 TaxID=3070681 RepID=UPI0027E1DFC4|nr:MarR family transcriptional regulator [Clostridium sp. OS1-26]WML37749.1 MarR family transcriptional regulator [Clostridium sp. OS1-26]